MNEERQIIFMEVRLIRLAVQTWNKSIERVLEIFKEHRVLYYIREGFGIFHCEGDRAVLDDIEEMLKRKGVDVYGD